TPKTGSLFHADSHSRLFLAPRSDRGSPDRRLLLCALRQLPDGALRLRRTADSDNCFPDYALPSAIKAWYKTGTYGCFCGFERWRATRCNFKRGSARPSLLFFTEQRISAGGR